MLSNGVKTSYTYDSRNRLVQAGNIHYEYDAEDVRTAVITPDYREDYTVDREATFSQVLSVSRTYVAGTKEETTYYYGSGLVYEKKTGTLSDDSQSNEDTTLQVYHFNHLGSTICLTDKTGTVTNRFNYGTYGELLTADKAVVVDITRFLYNGEYGVQTDVNGLYYMRSRYYSPEIRRFINQDVVTGSINQSASLNRYSYVEGNPVSYTDPFGLSPYQFISRTIHIGLDVVGIFVPGANVVNALYYFAEGNIYGGVESLIFSLAGGALGKGFKYAAAGGKTFTIGAETIAAITQGSRGLAAGLAANDVGQGIAGMIEDYGIDGKDISERTILEVLGILASGAQMGAYGNAFANGFAGAARVAGSERKSETSYGKSIENTEFFKENGGLDASDYISIHSRKHMYDPDTVSTPKKTQYGKDVNVGKLCEDTIMKPDEVIYNKDQNVMIYKKEYPFNISTSDTPTGTHRVFIPLNTQGKKTIRMSQFPLVGGN